MPGSTESRCSLIQWWCKWRDPGKSSCKVKLYASASLQEWPSVVNPSKHLTTKRLICQDMKDVKLTPGLPLQSQMFKLQMRPKSIVFAKRYPFICILSSEIPIREPWVQLVSIRLINACVECQTRWWTVMQRSPQALSLELPAFNILFWLPHWKTN